MFFFLIAPLTQNSPYFSFSKKTLKKSSYAYQIHILKNKNMDKTLITDSAFIKQQSRTFQFVTQRLEHWRPLSSPHTPTSSSPSPADIRTHNQSHQTNKSFQELRLCTSLSGSLLTIIAVYMHSQKHSSCGIVVQFFCETEVLCETKVKRCVKTSSTREAGRILKCFQDRCMNSGQSAERRDCSVSVRSASKLLVGFCLFV